MKKRALTTIAIVSLLSGCSLLAGHSQDLTVRTEPATATIYIDGKEVGKGHVTERVKRNRAVNILVTNPGYSSKTEEVRTRLSSTGIADLVGGALILIPAIGLVSPGAWELQRNTVMIPLEPAPQTAP